MDLSCYKINAKDAHLAVQHALMANVPCAFLALIWFKILHRPLYANRSVDRLALNAIGTPVTHVSQDLN